MDDRVGEVLAQRAALERSPLPGVLLSVLLHAGITGLALYAAMHQPPPKIANMLTIRFARLPAPAVTATARPPAPAPKPAAKTLQEPQAVVEQPKAAAPKPVPKTVPFSPFGKSSRKGSEAPPPPKAIPVPAQAAAPGIAAAGDVPVGASGVTGLEGGDFPYTIYIENMKRLIGTHWFRPQIPAGTTTTVYFTIDRDGTIRDVRTEAPSGVGAFDRAAERAVLESSPLPPLPFAYNGTWLGVHLTFK